MSIARSLQQARRVLLLGALAAAPAGCTGHPTLDPVETDDSDSDDAGLEGLLGILVQPERITIPVGQSIQLRATGLMEDRSSRDLTNVVRWGSSNASVAQVSDKLDEEGLIAGLALGEAQVWAEVEGLRSVDAKVNVTDASLLGLTVEPKQVDVEAGKVVQLKATAAFSDGTRSDASAQVRWLTGDGTVAQLATGGQLTAAGVGSTKVHAEWDDAKSDPVSVTVVQSAKADLRVKEVKGEASATSVTLTVTVENGGNVGASEFWVDAFVDPPAVPPAAGSFGDDYVPIEYLGANSTAKVAFAFELSPGKHDFYILVDADDAVPETDEANNGQGATFTLASGAPSGPNLTVQAFDFIKDPAYIYYAVDIYNSGTEDVEAFYVDLYVDRVDQPVPEEDGDEYVRVNSLAKGATASADFLIEEQCYYCWSWIFVDSYNYIPETNEADNYAGPLTVHNAD